MEPIFAPEDCQMAHSPNDRADPHQALESLARELNMHVGDVIKLYEDSVAELASKATIDTYLHVFAMRDLHDKLKVRKPS